MQKVIEEWEGEAFLKCLFVSKVHFSTGCFMQKLYIFQTILVKSEIWDFENMYLRTYLSHCKKGTFDLTNSLIIGQF